MAQADLNIANQSGSAFRADLNNQLLALGTLMSGASAPSTTYAYMLWADTTNGVLKIRNAANNAWITLQNLDGTRTLIGTSTALTNVYAIASALTPALQIESSNANGASLSITRHTSAAANLLLQRGVTGTPVAADEALGQIGFNGFDGTNYFNAALIRGVVDGTPGTGSMPGRLSLQTTPTGSTTPVERLRIDSTGQLQAAALGTAAAPIYSFVADTDTGIYSPGANQLAISTNGSQRVTVDSSGRVGIGSTAPSYALDVRTTGTSISSSFTSDQSEQYIALKDSGTTIGHVRLGSTSGSMLFFAGNAERGRFDSSGRLLVGTSSAVGTTSGTGLIVRSITSANHPGEILLQNGYSLPGDGSELGSIKFQDAAGSTYAKITGNQNGTASSSSDVPGMLVFSTTADGASSPTERMRISQDGSVTIGSTPSADSYLQVRTSQNITSYFDRTGNDGAVIAIRQDQVTEGTISVSGTTVSYNGAHLSRWSQLPNGAERTEILRGSVLSNIDEMCEWGDEENEQLNRMKVSDVEGDKNVSGVFQGWDDDDDTYTNDFYCAMTGDFIIRIAEGVTVERGDLLMSAGDGTAKPQDDDIIRSKTIAKVTSTNVSCTYDDGSYCVPCVLMAC